MRDGTRGPAVLERLSPRERAAFVLREVFSVPTDEVAAAMASSPAAVRQLVSRARARLGIARDDTTWTRTPSARSPAPSSLRSVTAT